MRFLTSVSLVLSLSAVLGCSSTRELEPIDNGLLVEASSSAREGVGVARAARDAAGDDHAACKKRTAAAEQEVELAAAKLKTTRAQLNHSKLAVKLAESGGSAEDLVRAKAQHTYALARADHARDALAVEKRALELAKLQQKLSLEVLRLRRAEVELSKAEALRGVDLLEAQEIPIEDYRKQVVYHQEETETALGRVRAAQARLDGAEKELSRMKRKVESLKPVE